MSRPIKTTSRPQMALQSYLDGLLQEATEELPPQPSVIEALPENVEAKGSWMNFRRPCSKSRPVMHRNQ